MNKPAATAALIGRAVAALEGRGKVVAGIMATADKSAVVLTVEGLAALISSGALPLPDTVARTEPLTQPRAPANDDPQALDAELAAWRAEHGPH